MEKPYNLDYAYFPGGQGVVSSNLATPTKKVLKHQADNVLSPESLYGLEGNVMDTMSRIDLRSSQCCPRLSVGGPGMRRLPKFPFANHILERLADEWSTAGQSISGSMAAGIPGRPEPWYLQLSS